MADQKDVRRIALSLPEVREEKDRFAFTVENKGKQHKLLDEAWRCQAPREIVTAGRVRRGGSR